MKTVDAISKNEVALVLTMLQKRYPPIYADIWKIGVNLSLRISDLLMIKFSDLNLANRELKLTEQETGKSKEIRLNNSALEVIAARQKQYPDDVFLFQVHSNRAKDKPISRAAVSKVFKEVGESLRLTINTHSMRKSRGKAMFDDGVPVAMISKVLNHSSEAATLRYLGITQERVLQTYDDFEL